MASALLTTPTEFKPLPQLLMDRALNEPHPANCCKKQWQRNLLCSLLLRLPVLSIKYIINNIFIYIGQLVDVLNLLKRCDFPQARWHELGLLLGLHINTLNAIAKEHPGDVSGCLIQCLSKWLSRADNVNSRGGATFDSLSDALKSMNENAAADKLDQESKLISLIVLVLTVYSI